MGKGTHGKTRKMCQECGEIAVYVETINHEGTCLSCRDEDELTKRERKNRAESEARVKVNKAVANLKEIVDSRVKIIRPGDPEFEEIAATIAPPVKREMTTDAYYDWKFNR